MIRQLLAQCPVVSPGGGGNVGAMDLGVAVGAAIEKQPLDPRCRPDVVVVAQHVPAMALEAEKRHGSREQVVVDGTVGGVAVHAVFGNVAMLERERTLFFHVAPGAGLLRGAPEEELFLGGTVRVVTVGAGHLLLAHRVMGEEVVLRLDLRMAAEAELRHLLVAHFLLRPLVELVAVKAADVVEGVGAGIPVGEVGS